MHICKGCKKEVEDDMKYCPYCGMPISEQEVIESPSTEKIDGEEISQSSSEKSNSADGKKTGVVIGLSALIPLGILLVVVGMLSHWYISVIGGICLGVAWSIYSYFLKK